MSARLSAALLLALLASCKHAAPKPATLEDELATIAPALATFDADIPRDSERIVISTTEIRISGDPYRIAHMPLAKDEVEDTILLPLRLALDGRERVADAGAPPPKPPQQEIAEMLAGKRVLVVADKRTPFSTLAPVVATAATGLPPTVLLVVGGKTPSVLPLHVGGPGHDRRTGPDLTPRLTIDERGVGVTIAGRGVARGCREEGPASTVTVPKAGVEHDDAALAACARSLHQALGEIANDELRVSAASDTDLATLVRVIAAFRTSFHEVTLSSPRTPR